MDSEKMELLSCPNCFGEAEYYPNSDSQVQAIYCVSCPLGLEDDEITFEKIVEIWNRLPRITRL